jgi:hypothetical protein
MNPGNGHDYLPRQKTRLLSTPQPAGNLPSLGRFAGYIRLKITSV